MEGELHRLADYGLHVTGLLSSEFGRLNSLEDVKHLPYTFYPLPLTYTV